MGINRAVPSKELTMNEHAKAFQICTPRSAMLRGEAGPEGIFAVNQRDVGTAEQREVARRFRTRPAAHYGATLGRSGPRWKQAQCRTCVRRRQGPGGTEPQLKYERTDHEGLYEH